MEKQNNAIYVDDEVKRALFILKINNGFSNINDVIKKILDFFKNNYKDNDINLN